MTGTPNNFSSPSSVAGASEADAERIRRKEVCGGVGSSVWLSLAADSSARWMVGTAVYQEGRNSFSQPRKDTASKPEVRTTLDPAASPVSSPEIRPWA